MHSYRDERHLLGLANKGLNLLALDDWSKLNMQSDDQSTPATIMAFPCMCKGC